MGLSETKKDMRERLRALRAALPEDERAELSALVLENLRATPGWEQAREVLSYMPVRGEVDVRPLLAEFWERGVRVLLPRCRPGEPGIMDLACVSCMEELRPGPYGIPEPEPGACPALPGARPDLILVPGVAFDCEGFRLGFGAGFYDRFLSGERAPGAAVYGLAYSFQVLERLPRDPWDVPVQAVITENEITWI
ncbi:5-formyltetrahydrofolate cyclo-ligase [Desulfocurvus sp. DL9XJH121]